jgi:hypothetical protein
VINIKLVRTVNGRHARALLNDPELVLLMSHRKIQIRNSTVILKFWEKINAWKNNNNVLSWHVLLTKFENTTWNAEDLKKYQRPNVARFVLFHAKTINNVTL